MEDSGKKQAGVLETKMPHYEESYFEGEEREGFFVESRMKRAWAAQLKVLKVIEGICKRHNLRYFADWGTLLGAVRHHGFIPWDDDLDIAMLRDDYEKFLVAAQEELPEEFELFCVYTDESFQQPFARITNGRRLRYDEDHMKQWYGCPYVVGVDIFQRDYLSRDEGEEELREKMMQMVIVARRTVMDDPKGNEEELQMVEKYCGVKLDRSKPLERQLRVLIDRLSQIFSKDEADEVALLTSYVTCGETRNHKDCYEEQVWVPFETTTIPIPAKADECLRAIYGADYMTPKIVLEHEYPFFERYEREHMIQLIKWHTRNSGPNILHFEDSYFEGEERSGFFVESKMKHAWAAQMELLKVIEEICRKYGLRYFADWGTLLGAVRHQGFIPWDDDLDIAMLRDDYEKFIEVAQRELPEGCEMLSVYTDENYVQCFVRVNNGRNVCYDEGHLQRWHGCPYKIGIDIFPRDYISRDEEKERGREGLLRLVMSARDAARNNTPDLEKLLCLVEKYCGVMVDRSRMLERQMLILIDRLSKMFSANEADEVADLYHYMVGSAGKCSKECYEKQEWMPFEVTEIAVPGDVHECLISLFKDDYMMPTRWDSHEYPFYEKQDRNFEEWSHLSESLAVKIREYIECGEWHQVRSAIREYRESGMWSDDLQMLGVLSDIYEKEQADDVSPGFFSGLEGPESWQKIYEKYMRVLTLLQHMGQDVPESEHEELFKEIKNKDISYDALILLIVHAVDHKKTCLSKLGSFYRESEQEVYLKRVEGIYKALEDLQQ